MTWLFDRALYVWPDRESLKRAEESAALELRAQSCVVSGARVDQTHRDFWRYAEAKAPRLRLVTDRAPRVQEG